MSRIWLNITLNLLTASLLSPPDLPNEMAWGTKKKMYYDTDYVPTSKDL